MYPFFMIVCFLSFPDSFDFRAQAVVDMLSTVVPHYYAMIQRIVSQRYTINHYLDGIVLLSDICHVAVGRKMATAVVSWRPSTIASIVHVFTLSAHPNL